MSIEDAIAHATPSMNGQLSPSEDAEAVLAAIRSGEIRTVIVGGSDIHGIFRAKRIPADRFLAKDEAVVEFSEYMLVMDLDEVPPPAPDGYAHRWPDWSTGFGDVQVVVDRGTLRRVPWLERTALALGDYRWSSGEATAIAPRNVLRRAIERTEALGLSARFATEFEFHIFRETEASALAKGLAGVEALSGRPMAYGALQATLDDRVIGPIVEGLEGMRVPVEAWAPEGGPGQYELNMVHADALEAADQGFLFKHSVKELCALQGLTATFMPKLATDGFGSSLHVHQSLWREDGSSAFYDEACEDGMSELAGADVAGYLGHFFARWTAPGRALEPAAVAEYVRAFSDPEALRCGFDDYRAAPLDAAHDEEDARAGRRLEMPLLVLWGEAGLPGRLPLLDVWREYAHDVRGAAIPDCGHFLAEEQPQATLAALRAFLPAFSV